MRKIKYNQFITENEVDGILQQKCKNHKCPSCGSNGIYAGCIETQYDEGKDEYVVLSFDIWTSLNSLLEGNLQGNRCQAH